MSEQQPLTIPEVMRILTAALQKYAELGGTYTVIPEFWFEGRGQIAIVMPEVRVINGQLARYKATKAE